MMILGMAVNIKGCFALAQVHVHAGRVLQTAQVSHMVIVIMGQDDGIDIFQCYIVLKLPQDARSAVEQNVLPADL